MVIIYRISDAGYAKVKPRYINNKNCLKNAFRHFDPDKGDHKWIIIADNVSAKTEKMIKDIVAQSAIYHSASIGNGAGTFNIALDYALDFPEDEIVYFLENDYLHKDGASSALLEGINLNVDYVSLYDHPDKYMAGFNPYVEGGSEETRVMLSKSCHWKITNSTTMTFASTVKTLKEDQQILREFTNGTHPFDFDMFLTLKNKGRKLITPLPSYSTHGETLFLAPLVDWEIQSFELSESRLGNLARSWVRKLGF
ncbi:hypothetical protein [Desertivirga xinjiangensis]|uniref:hypothetical protein n=1 Tax=Desertivirga xinjiangensis TaxID=539206 RepID=UPI00210E3D24|nr:hypothetical protein [Pedobacter xinjiangensis]